MAKINNINYLINLKYNNLVLIRLTIGNMYTAAMDPQQ